jgi:Uma2 family endonuclease
MALDVTRRRFTTAEYMRMGEAGVLGEDDRLELIEGEILELAPIGYGHAACVRRLTSLFSRLLGGSVQVSVQNPIDLGERTQPQPDLVLLRPRGDFYSSAHPTPSDVLLLVEVAETSGEYDRQIKLPLYAQSGVDEVWLVDLRQRRVIVYREPSERSYRTAQIFQSSDALSSATFPALVVTVADILG